MRRTRVLLLTLFLAPAIALAAETKSPPRPNIILILADDLGLGNVGCYGGAFRTPHIDAMAAGGIRFEQCYSTPLCGPSRCQLLTGRYPFRTGLINNQSAQAIQPGREIMIPTVLKKAGYVTASVGKWGQMSLGPGEWGFDEHLVFQASGRYWAGQGKNGKQYIVNGKPVELGAEEYLPDTMHRFVVDFIAKHKDRPFFVYYPMSHIHGPILRTPDTRGKADADQLYADNVTYMDKLVGQLMDELDRQKLREKTLVLFVGDNGTARFGVERATVHGRPISGQKGSMLEGGSRVPLIAHWPGIAPTGKVNRDLIDFSDFFTTCADLAGAKLPEGVKLDGRSFAPQLRGEKGTPREWVYVELNGRSYVRDGRFKLTNGGELFDLTEAPYKEIAVADDSADAAAVAARKQLQAVLDDHPAVPGAEKGKKAAKKQQQRARRKAARK